MILSSLKKVKEKKLVLVKCGLYAFNCDILCKYLPYINNNNAQNEYYLTDIIEIIKNKENINIYMHIIPYNNHYEIMGVNTQEQLKSLENMIK